MKERLAGESHSRLEFVKVLLHVIQAIVKDNYCRRDGCDEMEGPLSGIIRIDSIPSLIINREDDVTAMTSLVVDSFNASHTLLFLGTKAGKLMKVGFCVECVLVAKQ